MPHQVAYGAAVKSGFERFGVDAEITHKTDKPGDIHVCIGPNFALRYWRNSRTLLLDRAYWGDPKRVSAHWLKGGERSWLAGDLEPRDHPELKPEKTGDKTIYFCDYGEKPPQGQFDTVRRHPADAASPESLSKALSRHDKAAGVRSTALVSAAIAGLQVETSDPHSLVYPLCNGVDREQWITALAWHNWSLKEIESGEMLDGIGYDYPTD